MKAIRCAGLVAAVLVLASPAFAGGLFNASEGYVYYHRAGADMIAHDAAVDDCIQSAASLSAPYTPPGLMAQLLEIHIDAVLFRANLENCMVAKGWEVVRVPDDEGKRLSALPQLQQAAALAPWVGAADVHGDVVRRFETLPALWRRLGPAHSMIFDPVQPRPLSLTAGVHDLKLTREAPAATQIQSVKFEAADASVPADASVIVVRMLTSMPKHQIGLWFARLDDAPGKHGALRLDLFETASPVRLFWTKGPPLEQTFVAVVTPGRWRLLGPQSTSLCIGGPAFDVKPGEAVFAGSFDAAADDQLAPDMSLDAAKADIKDQGLAARLRPAHWMNGQTSPCGLAWAVSLYTYDIAGAPRLDEAAAH